MKQYQIRRQISHLLNFEYHTDKYGNKHSFHEMLDICKQSIYRQIFYTKYGISHIDAQKYSMDTANPQQSLNQSPLEQQQQLFMHQLIETCELVIQQPEYHNLNTLNQYINHGKIHNGMQLKKYYRDFAINFRFISLKYAMVYVALSQCKIWYIVCRNRKKSGSKGFQLDSLIEIFNQIVRKHKLQNPFHVSILTRKAVKHIQKKQNIQKSNNPLFDAVSNSDYDLVRQLIHNGAKLQKPSFYTRRHQIQMRCTHRACLNDDLQMCKILQSFGADWQAEDSQKMTPLFYAVQSGSLKIIKYLINEIKVDIQKQQIQDRTPFYFACTQNNLDVINYLYQIGCNINHKSKLGRTALSKACYLGRVDIVKFLLGCKQIDLYSQCGKGRTALHNAVFGPKGGREAQKFGTNQKDSPQCAQILLQAGFLVDKVDFENNTAAHIAMSSQAIDSIRVLLAYGASLLALNKYGQTPLLTGSKFGHIDAVRILYQEYKSQILTKDIFNKNIILLTAKFKQNGQDGTNPVFYYLLQPFVQKCKQLGNTKQLYYTFRQLLINQSPIQLQAFWKMLKKYKIELPTLQTDEIQKLLNLSINRRNVIESNLKYLKKEQRKEAFRKQIAKQSNVAVQILSNISIEHTKLQEIYLWLITNNDSKLLQFVQQASILQLSDVQLAPNKIFAMIENQSLQLKQKVISFCIMSMNFDWINYRNADNSNLIHLLIRKQRGGSLLQLFKSLSGKIPQNILTNRHITKLSLEERKKILQQLLWSKDQSELNAHQLSLILKNKSIAKIIEQKIKQQNLQIGQQLDIKQYIVVPETNPQKLRIFNEKSHQLEQQLAQFQYRIQEMHTQHIQSIWKLSTVQVKKKGLTVSHEHFWVEAENRKLIYIANSQQLSQIQILEKEYMIGIDLQYFNQEGITIVSTIQLSSLGIDFIIDCLSVPLQQISISLAQIFHSQKIIKIMHGADNDLILIRSSFNLCLINFLDTSRIDITLRNTKNDLRGLATLCKEYLGIVLSKQYQVSQWRIRPLPKAMLQYARKDSLILPYLLAEMFSKIDDIQIIRQIVVSGCRQVRRNKKSAQPLLAAIKSK